MEFVTRLFSPKRLLAVVAVFGVAIYLRPNPMGQWVLWGGLALIVLSALPRGDGSDSSSGDGSGFFGSGDGDGGGDGGGGGD
jgi:uncharacterized membrane protein YgcG